MAGNFAISRAKREEIKVKACLFGASGSGKTVTGLLVARGLAGSWDRVLVIDTEGDSALQVAGSAYGGVEIPQGDESFGHLRLKPPYTPERFLEALDHACSLRDDDGKPLFLCVVIDSLSHVWMGDGGILDSVDRMNKGFEGWKVFTPRLRRLVDGIRLAPVHCVFTLRASTEFEIQTTVTPDGKKKIAGIEKVGVKPQFRDGIDYEATVAWHLGANHAARCDKDRTQCYDGADPTVLGVADGERLRRWSEGAVTRIGGNEWVKLRAAELDGYTGTSDGLRSLWAGVSGHKDRMSDADYAALLAAKDRAKGRILAAETGK